MPSGVIWTLATDGAEKNRSPHWGAIGTLAAFLGAALAPIITGIILDATGHFTNVFILGGILLFMGACCYGFFVRKMPNPSGKKRLIAQAFSLLPQGKKHVTSSALNGLLSGFVGITSRI